jgi:hypothetical protein
MEVLLRMDWIADGVVVFAQAISLSSSTLKLVLWTGNGRNSTEDASESTECLG